MLFVAVKMSFLCCRLDSFWCAVLHEDQVSELVGHTLHALLSTIPTQLQRTAVTAAAGGELQQRMQVVKHRGVQLVRRLTQVGADLGRFVSVWARPLASQLQGGATEAMAAEIMRTVMQLLWVRSNSS
jgi:hypothetical protein